MPICINCGARNSLGDCCPDCAAYECDICNKIIDLDDEVTLTDPDTGEYNAYCQECLVAAIGLFRQTTNL